MKLAHRKTVAQRGRRFHDLVDFFVEYWPKIAFGFISLVGLFVSAFPDLKVQGFLIRHALFCVVLVLAIVAGWADLRRSASLKELEKRNARLNTQCRQYEKDVEKVLKVALKRLAEECEIADNENLLKHMRITVYCHDADFRRFIPVARIAGDARYEEPGRTFYPDNEGAIAEGGIPVRLR